MGTSVHLCGRLEVRWDGEQLDQVLPGRQGRLVFAYLTLHRDRPVRRAELVDALWSGAPPSDGDALLRPLLSRLRRALGPERLDGRAELAVRFPAETWVDWEAIRAGLRAARDAHAAGEPAAAWERARDALRLAEHELLPGFESAFVDQARAELDDVRFHLLETVAQVGVRLGPAEMAEAEEAARRAVQLSPYRDSARAALIEVLHRRGNVAEALVAYDEFRLLLREELGSLPGPELRALHEGLVAVAPAGTTTAGGNGRPPAADRNPELLLEREAERSLLQHLVGRAALGDGGVAVLEGQAGVGKTELLRTAAELGHDAGMTVLRARGSELDRDYAFGVVRQLLAREVVAAPALLAGGAELAGPALAPGEGGSSADLVASLEALHWLVVNLSARRPLLLLADDVHWADRPSLRWLVFLAERIEDVPVLLVAATRPAEPGADQELLDALATAPAARALHPAPLSSAATAALVRRHLPDAAEAFAAACHQATGGNPFLLGELLREAIADGRTGTEDEAGEVHQFGAERVGRTIRRRLRLQPPAAFALARAVAVLGPGTPLEEAAALAGLDEADAARAADALAAVDLLAAGRALDFVHPVVRSAVYEQVAPHERHALHRAAAELLRARGAESERVATHLLRVPPGAQHVAVLRAAAREALGRGATETAALYLR
ncbi:MAG TPA: BTAD domain-containing putative transcriptional regulator, partial [Solirubrobacteraceae bacterium]